MILVFLFINCSRSTPLLYFSATSFFFITVPVRKQWPELKKRQSEEVEDRERVSPPLRFPPPPPQFVLMDNRYVWVSPCGCGPGGLKGEPNRAFPILHEGIEKTSRPKSGRLASHWRTLHLSAELSLPISSPPHLLLPSSPPASPHWRSLGGYGCTYTLPFISIFLNSGFLFKWIIVQRCFNIKASVGH